MFQRIHQKLGTAGFIISIVALVAALGGGAYAASGGLTGKQKKEVEKIAKKYAGKRGKQGKQGPAGPAGPAGSAGAKGDKGDAGAAGSNGSNGAPGAAGTSVTNNPVPVGNAKCKELGGAEFKVGAGASTFACNGETGFTETLPKGKTEMGAWSYGETPPETFVASTSISFVIPLATVPSFHFITAANAGAEAANCPGEVAEPKAAAGQLCVYLNESLMEHFGGPFESLNKLTTAGVVMFFHTQQESGQTPEFPPGFALGTWAVTAP